MCTHSSDTVLWARRHCSHAGAGEAHLPVNTEQEWRAISMTIASVDFIHCALCRKGESAFAIMSHLEGKRVALIMFYDKQRRNQEQDKERREDKNFF